MSAYTFVHLDKENEQCIFFEVLLRELSIITERTVSDVGKILFRSLTQFKYEWPYSHMEFNLYKYNPVLGFQSDNDFKELSLNFLYYISLGRKYYESQNPLYTGYYNVVGDDGYTCLSHVEGFYFKASEIYCFLRSNKLPIPPCISSNAKEYESSYEFFMEIIDEEDKRLADEVKDILTKSVDDISSVQSEIDDLKGKSKHLASKKTTNSQAKLIKSLLYLVYKDFDLIDNPRSYIDNPKSEIRTDFENFGLTLPSGKTVEKWLKDVDIDIQRK